ncbi:hypothetical protein KDM87_03675 [Undibacterium sp. FT147W]|uniref:Uncharacterized protein n=1 Tax=Undibacterium rivi TaxID=2828729 RepID=A0ABS5GYY7_9BURK|nr:hypothetical protein [Undibacterium rivi]MBR7791682.1 hypothetical protein [Undibacterium rivi]
MAKGSTQSVLVCTPSTTASTAQQAVCPKVGTQFYVPTKVQAYLLDPSQQNNIDAALGDFDYAYASGLWSLAFSMVVGLYFVSHGIGQVLGMVRRG